VSRIPKTVDSAAQTRCSIKAKFSRKAGRPSNAMAGDVEERIAEAATAVFMRDGFGGASLERIAEAAGASKATLYSRFSGKEALFGEVVSRICERKFKPIYENIRASGPIEERLMSAVLTISTQLLSDEVLGLIRMVIAEAPRFPSLAKLTRDTGKERSIDVITTILAEHFAQGVDVDDTARADILARARPLATRMLDATNAPLLMRALMREDIDAIRGDLPLQVEQTIGLFIAAGTLR
jgi:AcrR family transcriptional regulator